MYIMSTDLPLVVHPSIPSKQSYSNSSSQNPDFPHKRQIAQSYGFNFFSFFIKYNQMTSSSLTIFSIKVIFAFKIFLQSTQ